MAGKRRSRPEPVVDPVRLAEPMAAKLYEVLRILSNTELIDPFARKQAREKLREFFDRFG